MEIIQRYPALTMSTDSPNNLIPNSAELSIGIVCASFNSDLCESLLAGVTSCLQEKDMLKELLIERVLVLTKLPSGIDLILESASFDCMIGLGVVIKGSTSHHHLVAEASVSLCKIYRSNSTLLLLMGSWSLMTYSRLRSVLWRN